MAMCDEHRNKIANSGNLLKTDDNLLYFPVTGYTKEDVDRLERVHVKVNEKDLTIVSSNKILYAVDDLCPHRGGNLSTGDIEEVPGIGPCIKCPVHGWKFELKKGRCLFPGGRKDVLATIYPIKVEHPSHRIFIGFGAVDPTVFAQDPP